MTDYRKELIGAIKGNARLRRRLDASKERVAEMESRVRILVAILDALGYGDTEVVRSCAWSVGWKRDPEVARKCREATA